MRSVCMQAEELRADEIAACCKKCINGLENKMIRIATIGNVFYIRWEINV